MKQVFLLLVLSCCFQSMNAQLRVDSNTPTTTTLPEGTISKGGTILVKAGYKAVISPNDSKVVLIQPVSNNRTTKPTSITGTFTCNCSDNNKTNDCSVVVRQQEVYCTGETCGSSCQMLITIKPKAGLAITRQTKGEVWKIYAPVRKQ